MSIYCTLTRRSLVAPSCKKNDSSNQKNEKHYKINNEHISEQVTVIMSMTAGNH